MKQRCLNPNNHKFSRYGKRGISVTDEWLDFKNFEYWANNNGFEISLTLDRIDTDGNYEPSNCRWVDQSVQQNNRNNNRIIVYKGKDYTLSELSKKTNIESGTLARRIKQGATVEEAVEEKLNAGYIRVNYKGETKPLKRWCEELNLPYKTIYARVSRGWDPKDALKKPVRKGNYKRAVPT